jgi:UDP-N-acetylmuramoylalanine--D-glutamate ligase
MLLQGVENAKRRALVLGRGKSGEAAAELLARQGFDVSFAEDLSLVVASPGLPVKSELQIGCEELLRRGWKLLAVTGSKGKSSVVKVVADALSLAGLNGIPCGNYGRPVSDLLSEEPGWAVVEISSFQLETTALPAGSFVASAILNIQEDHLDRHGDISVYAALKMRLKTMSHMHFEGLEKRSSAEVDALLPFADFCALTKGTYFDNDVLRINAAYAVALMRAAGLDDAIIRRAFKNFKPLAHRFQKIAEIDGVTYIDDSKATSLSALSAAVSMCEPTSRVRLIAGGLPKGDDPKSVLPTLTDRVEKVYLIGRCAQVFCAAWADAVDCVVCGDLSRAVAEAMREACCGEIVLLSPGCASFDQFTDFGSRGDVFADLVHKGRRK